METKETVCRRCGKEVTPKSDCGGFYDLVPAAAAIVPPAPVQVPVAQKPAKKSGLSLILAILCCVLLVALAASIVAGNRAKNDADRYENKLDAVEEAADTPYDERDFKAVMCLGKEAGSYSMKVDSDMPGSVVVKCSPSALLAGLVSGYTAELTDFDEKNATATLKLNNKAKAADKEDALSLQMALGEAFGELDAEALTWSLAYVETDEQGNRVLKQLLEGPMKDTEETEDETPPTTVPTATTEPTATTLPKEDGKGGAGNDNSEENNGTSPDEEKNELLPVGGINDEGGQHVQESSEPTVASTEQTPIENTFWLEIAERVSLTTEDGTVAILLPYECLRNITDNYRDQMTLDTEFVLTLVWRNKQGGSFTVVVEGITVRNT